MSSDLKTPQKVLLQERGMFTSSHLSMFPAKTSEEAVEQWKEDKEVDFSGMNNNVWHIEIAPTDGPVFHVPANLMYYIQERTRHGPKYTYVVPIALARALAGSVAVQVYSVKGDFPNSGSESVGWIEYGHEDGKAYSGTSMSISFTVQEYPIKPSCYKRLMEFGENHESIPTADASMLSEAQRTTYYHYAKRMWILYQLANQHPSFPPDELQAFWNAEKTVNEIGEQMGISDAKDHYANLTTDKSKPHANLVIRFPPIDAIGFEIVDGQIVIKEEPAIK